MAVICKKSIRRGLIIQGILVLVVLLGAYVSAQCDQARVDLHPVGFGGSALLEKPSHGELCGDSSCCTNATEQIMWNYSKRRLETFLRDSITKLASLFDVRAKKFDGIFREMLNNSHYEFHDMFAKTYGKIYLQNQDLFIDFFKELELYYRQGASRLTDTLETFFGLLYQRMFTVINSQYEFDEKYLQCVLEHMDDVKPFADVPQKFTVQLRRSFVATRTFHKALATAGETVRRLLEVRVDGECEKRLVYMQFCGACKGQGRVACSGYCTEVLKDCLGQFAEMEKVWDAFIEAVDKVGDRLIGPYNIEIVVEPLNIKISEAIMNFQESGTEVSRKLYHFCGKPSLNRRKRKVSYRGEQQHRSQNKAHKRKKTMKNEDEEEVTTLEKIIKEIKVKIRETRQFWRHLPYQYCNNITAPPNSSASCWSSRSPGAQSTQPPATSSSIVGAQVYRLQDFSDKLRKAYHGEEVDIVDDTEEEQGGSGSGSGDFEIDSTDDESEDRGRGPDLDRGFVEVDNELPAEPQPPVQESTKRPQITRTYSASGAGSISLSRALAQYLLPIVLVWFGGAISDLL